MVSKDVVAGLGEIGRPILEIISKAKPAVGFDINDKLMDKRKFEKYEEMRTWFLHVCIPFTKNFIPSVISLYKKFRPHGIVIHSTISPGTTNKIQTKLSIPVIYSATREINKRMSHDLRRYRIADTIEIGSPKRG